MGGPSDERDLRRTRTAYVGAAYRLMKAMERLRATAPPLLPNERETRGLPAWTPEQREAMRACADTFAEVTRLHALYARMEGTPSR